MTVGPWLARRLSAARHRWPCRSASRSAPSSAWRCRVVLVFGRLPLVSVPANVLAVPVAGFVMLYGLPAALVAGSVPAAGGVVMVPAGLGVRWVDTVALVGERVEPPPPRACGRLGRSSLPPSRSIAWRADGADDRPQSSPMACTSSPASDESVLRSTVSDTVHELVGDGDRIADGRRVRRRRLRAGRRRRAASTPPFLTEFRIVVGAGRRAVHGRCPRCRSSATWPSRARRPIWCWSAAADGR